ncbi:MAG TPA: hypothetical protein PLU72_07535 [Candidatus Ozemobacteraceae bacterium]|nr:hypothetical protein [Candidatus Ozemobacteraceae bacterium]HQG29381.1 hypothetical protein [Candidatus Ozemobacteraceae bacterium]
MGKKTKPADAILFRRVVVPGILMFLLNHFWFGFELVHPYPVPIIISGISLAVFHTIYFALTCATTCDRRYPISSLTRNDLYRLRQIEPGDVLANIVVYVLFAFVASTCVNGLVPIKTVGHDTTVLDIKEHRSSSRNGRGSSETYTLDVASWLKKGETISLSIDRTTALKLNHNAPIHIETKIGLLGLEFYRKRHQTFTFQKGYLPPFRQPD